MKRFLYAILLLSIYSCQSYTKHDNGITVNVKNNSDTRQIKVEVINDNVIHVLASAENQISAKTSLIIDTLSITKNPVNWSVRNESDNAIISTSQLSVRVNLKDGKVSFYDKNGNLKLKESEGISKTFIKNESDEPLYSIMQKFASPDSEAFYGLGQHQNAQMNYKGQDVDLTQYNIVAVVPFLVSSKNYGLLWDNYSRSKFGDTRDYQPISGLKLIDQDGNSGGLTATYYTSADKKQVFIKRVEKSIDYHFLSDLSKFPLGFPLQTGLVEWKGSIESGFEGLNKFLSYSAGYLKIWIDDQLVVESWRQCWNPWTRKFNVEFNKNEKHLITIQWIPDGGESYMALDWLSPMNEQEQNQLCLSSESGRSIDYYFINGENTDSVISNYRQITGKSPIMPKWAMGFWQSRERYKTQDELLNVVKEYRKLKIPLDNIVLDWQYWPENKWGSHDFDLNRFPDATSMLNELHNDLNTHLMISVWAKYYVGTANYDIMDSHNWLYKRNVEQGTKDWVGPGYVSTFYDAFNRDARKEFWRQLNEKLFSKGIDGWWLDATEPDIHSNTSLDEKKLLDGPTALGSAEEYFNAYSLMQSEAVYNGQRTTNPNQRVFILTRSAFAGQQRYAAATWSGDVASRWYDLQAQISAGLNFSVSGIPYWTTDIGGFAVERRYEHPDKENLDEWRELNTRWFQFGAFCPIFRSHGQYPYREIFNLSPKNSVWYNSMVYYDNLRYRLMPYIYSLAGATWFQNYTIMRPLFMDFSNDSLVARLGDEYMFGPSILVAPVTSYQARNREVYLPKGSSWYDFYTGIFYQGGQKLNADASVDRLPLYIKAGAIIPVGVVILYTAQETGEPLEIKVYQGNNGNFTLYEDDGTTYNYEKGQYSSIPFSYSDSEQMLVIGERKGTFDGMNDTRKFSIRYIRNNQNAGFDHADTKLTEVVYSGQPLKIKLNEN